MISKLRKRPIGLVIFGLILIGTSAHSLYYLPHYDYYKQINHEWPDAVIKIRFIGSYLFRLLGLCLGVGVLCLDDFSRKFLIGFSWYSLFTLPLRHTFQSQLFSSEPIYYQHGSIFSLATFTWIVLIIRWVIDGVFSLSVIYYFNKSRVIDAFLANKQERVK